MKKFLHLSKGVLFVKKIKNHYIVKEKDTVIKTFDNFSECFDWLQKEGAVELL